MKFPDTLYHYTIGPKIPLIAHSAHLKPFGFGGAANPREKAVLWWSCNPEWEPTATKIVSLDGGRSFERPTVRALHDLVGCFRFRLDVRNPVGLHSAGVKLLPWTRIPLVAGIAAADVQRMVLAGLELGAVPNQWWGCLEEVPVHWEVSGLLQVDLMQPNGSWQPLAGMAEALERANANPTQIRQLRASQVPQARGL
jgi:hypothetical protein